MDNISFELKNYKLNKINFCLNNRQTKSKRISIKKSITTSHSDLADKEINVYLNICISCAIFNIDVEYEGLFCFNSALESANIETKEKIIHVNCTATLFPFARELIAETTRRAELTPLVLPSHNFVSSYEKLIKSKNDEHKKIDCSFCKTIGEIPA